MTTQGCGGLINLRTPVGSERRRGFQPPYYTVYLYKCPACGSRKVVRANSFRGRTPEPGIGAIRCDGPIPNFAPTYRGEPARCPALRKIAMRPSGSIGSTEPPTTIR